MKKSNEIKRIKEIPLAYTHPTNHAPSMIIQDASNRFVTDAEKSTWNGKATQATIDASINAIQIGGRNLYKGTGDFNSAYWVRTSVKSAYELNTKYSQVAYNGNDNTLNSPTSLQGFDFRDTTKTWTISAMFKGTQEGQTIGVILDANRWGWNKQAVTNGAWTKITWTFPGVTALTAFRFAGINITASYVVYIAQIKVEEGNKATDWTPAPEDVDSAISKIESSLSEKANITYVDTKVGNMGNTKTFKGSCLFVSLPTIGMVVDDYWYVTDKTTNYCYNGTTWVDIGNNLKIGNKTIDIDKVSESIHDSINNSELFSLISSSFEYDNLTLTYADGVLSASTLARAFHSIFLPVNVAEIIFKKILSEVWVILGGTSARYTALQFRADGVVTLADVINSGTLSTDYAVIDSTYKNTSAFVSTDVIRVVFKQGIYTFYKNNVLIYTLNVADITSTNAVGIKTNNRLGFIGQKDKATSTGIVNIMSTYINKPVSENVLLLKDDVTSINEKVSSISEIDANIGIGLEDLVYDACTLEYSNSILTSTVTEPRYFHSVFMPEKVYNVTFNRLTTEVWLILGGTSEKYTALQFISSGIKTFADVKNSGTLFNDYTVIDSSFKWSGTISTTDEISVNYSNDVYTFYVNGVLVYTLDITTVLDINATGFKANQNLGFVAQRYSTHPMNIVKINEVKSKVSSVAITQQLQADVEVLKNSREAIPSQWKNKIWNVGTDSITVGFLATKPYHSYVQDDLGIATVNNYGITSTELCTSGTSPNPFINRYLTMNKDADLITILTGANDYLHNAELGTFDSRDNDTFYGALHNLCIGLYDNFPNAKYGFFTPLKINAYGMNGGTNAKGYTFIQYVNAIKAVCGYYCIDVLDLHNMSGITPLVPSANVKYFVDGCHPLNLGHRRIADVVIPFIIGL